MVKDRWPSVQLTSDWQKANMLDCRRCGSNYTSVILKLLLLIDIFSTSCIFDLMSFIKPSIMKMIYDRTIQPVIDYGCSVWYNTTSKNLEKLQKVQNYAARIISGNFDYINVRSILLIRSLKWMTISERCEYFTAMLMFKAINGLVPNYLSDSIVMAGESHDRDTRLSESLDVHIPSHNSSALKRSFIYNGSVLGMHCLRKLRHQTVYSHLKRDTKSKSYILCSINKSRRNFKEPSLQIVLWSLYCFVFSHLYFIWIAICILYELPYIARIPRQLCCSSLDFYF